MRVALIVPGKNPYATQRKSDQIDTRECDKANINNYIQSNTLVAVKSGV